MENVHQSTNNESRPLLQSRNTYRQFLTSVSGFVHQLCDCTRPQMQINGPGYTDQRSPPSTSVLPGSYPLEMCKLVESNATRRMPLEEPDFVPCTRPISEGVTASASQAGMELGQHNTCGSYSHPIRILSTSDISALSAPSHDLIQSQRLEEPAMLPCVVGVSEQVITSTPQPREEFGKHGAFCDRSERPVVYHSSSQNERSHTPVQPTTTALFQGAHGFSISGNPNFTTIGYMAQTNVTHYGGFHGLEHMEKFVSFNAFHNSSVQDPDRKCHPGTRVVVLDRIRNWFNNATSAERAFWLHGPAGAGKSAIAQTIARSCRDQAVATFFFYKSDASRNDGNCLFTTIAWQLAFSIPGVKDHIARALERRPDLPRMDVETQFEKLIIQAFQALKDTSTHLRSLVIIIDGVDECIDLKLQRRFLKLIGNAIKNNDFPLRFLICSRPEAHIQETIDMFPKAILRTDLANLDDANHDIEKYLKDEFFRVASEQGLDSITWPGDAKIQQVLYKSSGQFVYASTVIRYVSDEYNSAVTQLDIILGLKPPSSKSPFAELDALFIEILERQPDPPFLTTFLAVLVARLSLARPPRGRGMDNFHLDDAMLMNVSELELHRKLRGMRSLFKFEPFIDLHHRSFLDFLQDSSRSCQFYISRENAQRRYLELITDSVVRFAEKTIDQPNYHETGHFHPQFHRIAHVHPLIIKLPLKEWQKTLQPLLCLQDKLLKSPNFTSTWDLLPCDTCTVFQVMRDFLSHLIIMQGTSHPVTSFNQTIELCLNGSDVNGSSDRLIEAEQSVHEDELVGCIYSLLSQLRNAKLGPSVNTATIDLMYSLLRFDYVEVSKRVNSIADAQILMDFIDSLTNDNYFLSQHGPDTACKVVRLALEIYARVPVLPQSVFSSSICPGHEWPGLTNKNFETRCQTVLLRRISDHNYVVPLLRIYEKDDRIWFVGNIAKCKSLREWRNSSKPSSMERVRVILEVAKAIRYLHSIGTVLDFDMALHDTFLDSNLHAKICTLCTTSRYLTETPANYLLYESTEKEWDLYETNVHIFGCFFYEVYFDKTIQGSRYVLDRSKVSDRPIPEDAWQLIQRCCAKDPKGRPSMDQVVQEMESWNLF